MKVDFFAKSLSSGRYYVVLSDKDGENKKITDGLLFWNGTRTTLKDLQEVKQEEVPASVRHSLIKLKSLLDPSSQKKIA